MGGEAGETGTVGGFGTVRAGGAGEDGAEMIVSTIYPATGLTLGFRERRFVLMKVLEPGYGEAVDPMSSP